MEKMKSSRPVLTLALALTAVCWTGARAKTPIAGVVTAVTGKPQVQSEGEGAFKSLKNKQNVYEGDVLKTGKNDLIAMIFVGGAELRINSGSTFQVDSGGGEKPTSVFSELGQAWTNLIHGGAQIEIHTPTAVCAVRGTQADVNVGGNMTVKVYEGFVDLQNEKGTVPMTAGQISQVIPGQAPQPPQKMTPAQYGTWQNTIKPQNVAQLRAALLKTAKKERTLELKSNKNGKQTDIKIHLNEK